MPNGNVLSEFVNDNTEISNDFSVAWNTVIYFPIIVNVKDYCSIIFDTSVQSKQWDEIETRNKNYALC
ncbi:MAG: hypothetical protein LBM99_05375, partial [Bacillales bacterium]|nr:hypothetical protein [Bacillales bacterium]